MKLNETLKDKIADIFREVEYGKIHFSLSPERETLDCTVETTHKIPLSPKGSHNRGDFSKNT